MAKTVTGSVAEMRDPNMSDSKKPKLPLNPPPELNHVNIPAKTNVFMVVPMNAKAPIEE